MRIILILIACYIIFILTEDHYKTKDEERRINDSIEDAEMRMVDGFLRGDTLGLDSSTIFDHESGHTILNKGIKNIKYAEKELECL